MGRLEHLNRLGLGRSAFHPLQQQQATNLTTDLSSTNSQQYDEKGRPTNPAATKLNADLRYAQNEVLELADIVERKANDPESQPQHTHTCEHEAWYNARLDILADFVALLATWYPETLVQRSLLGIYSTDLPFAAVVAADIAAAQSSSVTSWPNIFLPGLGFYVVHALLTRLVYRCTDQLATKAWVQTWNRHIKLCTGLAVSINDILRDGAHIQLMPMLHFAVSARQGLLQPRSLKAATTMLIGFYHLCNAKGYQLKMVSTTLALPMFHCQELTLHGTFSSRDHSWRDADPREKFALMSINGSISEQVRLGMLRSYTRILQPVDLAEVHQLLRRMPCKDKDSACDLCRHTPPRHTARLAHLPSMVTSIFLRIMQLPLELSLVHYSARALDRVLGPVTSSLGGTRELPIQHDYRFLLGKPAGIQHVDKTAYLSTFSKIGLALVFSFAVESVVRGGVYSLANALVNRHYTIVKGDDDSPGSPVEER